MSPRRSADPEFRGREEARRAQKPSRNPTAKRKGTATSSSPPVVPALDPDHCPVCGSPIAQNPHGGQRRRFCSPAHRFEWARTLKQAIIEQTELDRRWNEAHPGEHVDNVHGQFGRFGVNTAEAFRDPPKGRR